VFYCNKHLCSRFVISNVAYTEYNGMTNNDDDGNDDDDNNNKVEELQKTATLGTAHILRKVLM